MVLEKRVKLAPLPPPYIPPELLLHFFAGQLDDPCGHDRLDNDLNGLLNDGRRPRVGKPVANSEAIRPLIPK